MKTRSYDRPEMEGLKNKGIIDNEFLKASQIRSYFSRLKVNRQKKLQNRRLCRSIQRQANHPRQLLQKTDNLNQLSNV